MAQFKVLSLIFLEGLAKTTINLWIVGILEESLGRNVGSETFSLEPALLGFNVDEPSGEILFNETRQVLGSFVESCVCECCSLQQKS